MKRLFCGALVCLLLLSGCGAPGSAAVTAFDPEETTQAVLDSGAFSEQLEKLDPDLIALLFGLPGDPTQYEGSALYYSTGATSEAAAVIHVSDKSQTASVESALEQWVELQIEATRNYQPAEVEKLEHAILETREDTVLLVVAADWETAEKAIP